MPSAHDILTKFGIRANDGKHGNQTTTCPKCSHLRKKKRDRCLSVKIDGVGVQFHCHHCGYEGGEFFSGNKPAAYRTLNKPVSSYAKLQKEARYARNR